MLDFEIFFIRSNLFDCRVNVIDRILNLHSFFNILVCAHVGTQDRHLLVIWVYWAVFTPALKRLKHWAYIFLALLVYDSNGLHVGVPDLNSLEMHRASFLGINVRRNLIRGSSTELWGLPFCHISRGGHKSTFTWVNGWHLFVNV
jgi:hypothetical protein